MSKNSENSVVNIALTSHLIEAIQLWLEENMNLDLTVEEIKKIEDLDRLLVCMLEGDSDIEFEWRIRDPLYAMGQTLERAYENVESDDEDDDTIVFTGYWEHM